MTMATSSEPDPSSVARKPLERPRKPSSTPVTSATAITVASEGPMRWRIEARFIAVTART